jgi:hypothetical protein
VIQKSINRISTIDDDDEKLVKRERGQRDLEMNHSHYLMLDDGRLRHYDIEDYRTRLCVQLAKLQHENDFPSKFIGISFYDYLCCI